MTPVLDKVPSEDKLFTGKELILASNEGRMICLVVRVRPFVSQLIV